MAVSNNIYNVCTAVIEIKDLESMCFIIWHSLDLEIGWKKKKHIQLLGIEHAYIT